ncbi:11787_t:CDS:2 [Ambispora gerdemannii]|uniref:11787_t:CDS:1 n=1 Tax=Ambispora gerdemannii TaxID=144530 RepID=A0A9N9CPD1_9GLOM|nr:11787_t:CDS:2 [Ambispora gerdemannii]
MSFNLIKKLLPSQRIWNFVPNSASTAALYNANTRIWHSYTSDIKTEKSGAKIDNQGNEEQRYKGYWTLILNQPSRAKQDVDQSNKLIFDNEDINSSNYASKPIASIALKNDQVVENRPMLTVDGEIIPQKPMFPDNCCMRFGMTLSTAPKFIITILTNIFQNYLSGFDIFKVDVHIDIYAEEYREWREITARIRDRLLRERKPVPLILSQEQNEETSTNQSSKQQGIDDATSARGPGFDEGMRAFLELERKLKGN